MDNLCEFILGIYYNFKYNKLINIYIKTDSKIANPK